MFKRNKILILALVLGIFFSFVTSVMAGSATSSKKYFGPYAGYSYYNDASVYNTSGVYARVSITTQPLSNVPTGYMGISAYLYNDSGVCVDYSDWWYNDSPAAGISDGTHGYYTSGTYYYADGITKVYNGNGYTSVYTYVTPNLYY